MRRRVIRGEAVYYFGKQKKKPKKRIWPPEKATAFVRGYPVRKTKAKKTLKEKKPEKKALPRHTAFATTINGKKTVCSFTRTGNLITVEIRVVGHEGAFASFYTATEALMKGEKPSFAGMGQNFAANCGNAFEAFQKAASELKKRFNL